MGDRYKIINNNFLLINDTIPHSGYFNMEFDIWLFELSLKREIKPVLRIYTWDGFAITTGKYHKIEQEIDIKKCERFKIPVIKRPTGGRMILHHRDEITFSLIIPKSAITPFDFRTTFLFVSEQLCNGFKNIGIDARLSMKPSKYQKSPLCFQSISQYEIIDSRNRKIAGIAQVIKKDTALLQGSIPYKNPAIETLPIFKANINNLFENDLIEKEITGEEIRGGIISGFGKVIKFMNMI